MAQWRYLPRFLSRTERQVVILALVVAIVSAGGLGAQYVLSHQTVGPAVGGEYTEGLVGLPGYINPLYAAASDTDADLTRLVFSGLMRYSPTEGLVPDLAESYSLSEDQKTYTFFLRDNATFHDGERVSAEDVVFTINAIQNPDYDSPLAVSFAGVVAEQLDDRSVRFTLDEPFSPFLSALTVGILPTHLWQEIPPTSARLTTLNIKPIGSGPYIFEKLVKDPDGILRSLTLTRNADFYRGAPYIENLTFKFAGDATELSKLLHNRNVQGAAVIPFGERESFVDDRSVRLVSASLPQYTAVFLNQKHSTLLQTDALRQALAQAVDRTAINQEILGGTVQPVHTLLMPGFPGYDANATIPVGDATLAAATLENAGWKLEEGATVRTKDNTPLTLTLTVLNSPELMAVAEKLVSFWAAVGVQVTLQPVDGFTLQNDVLKSRAYDMLLTGERFGSYPDPYPFWHSSQTGYPGLNLALFTNRKADEAIETARLTTDETKRAEAFKTLSDAIAEENAAIFLYVPSYTFAVDSSLSGVNVPRVTTPSDRFADINTWYSRTKRVFGK